MLPLYKFVKINQLRMNLEANILTTLTAHTSCPWSLM